MEKLRRTGNEPISEGQQNKDNPQIPPRGTERKVPKIDPRAKGTTLPSAIMRRQMRRPTPESGGGKKGNKK